jgi:membrane protein DedA with SNARE-associated domain
MLAAIDDVAHDALETAGYGGLIAVMIVENLVPPIPSELVLPLAGYEVSRGELTFVATVAAATLGSLVGALILYAIGRWGGRPAIDRWGRRLHVGPQQIDRAETWFARWGDWVVLGARLVPGARSVVSIPAGTMRMGVARFTALTTLGSAIWNTVLIGAGWALGDNWEAMTGWVGSASKVVLVVAVLAIAIGGLVLAHRVRRGRQAS